MSRRFILPALCLLCASPFLYADSPGATLTWFQKITPTPGHHAFTDLIFFNGYYYLCNRVGTGHVSMDGEIVIRRSEDMKVWEECATVKTIGDDRDAKLVVANDRIYVFFGVWNIVHGEGQEVPQRDTVRSYMASSDDGTTWSKVVGTYDPGWWLWRVHYIDDAFYSVAYTALRPVPSYRESRLLKSVDGIDWKLVSTITKEHMAGEADFWKRDKESFAVLSRTGDNKHARFFSSDSSLRSWDDVELNAMVHSPVVAFWFDRTFVAGRGEGDGQHVTKLWELKGATLVELLTVPSGGDNAYPGLVTIPESLYEDEPRFYISWYSQVDASSGEKEPDGGAGVYVGEVSLAPAPTS